MEHHHFGVLTSVCQGYLLPQFSEPVLFTFGFSDLSYNERTDYEIIMKLKYCNVIFKQGWSHLNNVSEWMYVPLLFLFLEIFPFQV